MKRSVFALFNLPLLWRGLGGGLLLLSGFGTVAFAQGAEVCEGAGYTIADAVPASAGSEYRWTENGNVLAGTNQAAYNVPNNKATGVYTYVRQSKSADCPDWQSSNEFTVTVFACSFTAGTETGATATFIDPRDGKPYKTVVMPDGRTWFAQNLNYTKDLTANAYSYEANGKQFTSVTNGVPAIGSYWCSPVYWVNGAETTPVVSGDLSACDVYGAMYTWETAMMIDGRYADESKTSSVWEESWVSANYLYPGAPGTTPNADKNNARGATGRGICPMGWHVPTDYEWANLLDAVEGNTTYTVDQTGTGWWGTDAGKKLKSAATFTNTDPGDGSWLDHPNRGTDNFGFGAVPAGPRGHTGSQFYYRGSYLYYWTSSMNEGSAWYRRFINHSPQVDRLLGSRAGGHSVRCVKD
jgi:uncharacterized protein (TIGR02145 family)